MALEHITVALGELGVGRGTDTITDAGGADRVEPAAGITAAQLRIAQTGNDRLITIAGQADKLVVKNW